jgi:hypothetical protein
MKYLKVLIPTLALSFFPAKAQLPDGSVAPDFNLVDYYGNPYHLYDILDSDKTVFLEFFAAHCPSCWNYHQSQKLKSLYLNYGPQGSNEIMVLALEIDQWNDSNAFIGNGPPWVTQGNWLNDTPFPIFNVEDPHRQVFSDYAVSFYPLIYKICPDKILEQVFPSQSLAELYQKASECPSVLSLSEPLPEISFFIDPVHKKILFGSYQQISSWRIIHLTGQIIESSQGTFSGIISFDHLPSGVYLLEMESEQGYSRRKIFLP